MKRYLAYTVMVGIGLIRVGVWLLRYVLLGVLLSARPVVSLLFGVATAFCLIGLVMGLVMARDQHQMIWAFFGTGVVSTAIPCFYDALVLVIAPRHFPSLIAK